MQQNKNYHIVSHPSARYSERLPTLYFQRRKYLRSTDLTPEKRLAMPDHLKFQAFSQLEAIGDRSPAQYLWDLRRKYQAAGGVTGESH